jgi:hypothetical protein
MTMFRWVRALIFWGLLLGSLTLNVATVAIGSVATLVAGAFEAVSGAVSVTGGLQRELEVKNQRIASLSSEVASLKQPKSVTYRGQRKLLSEAVEDTVTRVSRRTTTAAVRNAGSVFAEAIPFAGIAVVVGVTAWDLRDSCETLKDLQAFHLALNPLAEESPDQAEVCGLTVPTSDEVWAAVKSSPSSAWEGAKQHVPELPELSLPKFDWRFWQ